MGLEVATYISGLTATWPQSTDQRKQGDDHLRLVKAVLQATFPNADRAFRFPKSLSKTGNYSVLATDDGALILVDTSGGNVTLTLPSVPATFFNIGVVKTTADANTVIFAGPNVNGGTLTPLATQWQNVQIFGNGSAYYAPRPIPPNLIQSADIAAQAVTLAKLVNASAQGKGLFRKSASAGSYEEASLSEMFNTIASVARGDIWVRGAANWDRLALGAAGRVLKSDGTDLVFGSPKLNRLHVREEQTSGTNSATATTTGSWITMALNQEKLNEITGASLASNEITLPAGDFSIDIVAQLRFNPGGGNHAAKIRFYNQTDGAVALEGHGASFGTSAGVTVGGQWDYTIKGRISIAGSKVFRLQQQKTGAVIPLALSLGTEVYTDVVIEQL